MMSCDDRHNDVYSPHADAETLRVVEDLAGICARSTSLSVNRRMAIDRTMHQEMALLARNSPSTRRFSILSWLRRPAVVIGGVAATAILVGGVYAAAVSLGDQALPPGIVQQNLGRTLSLTQGACGLTMTLNRVYADAQQIMIGYTLKAPAGFTAASGLGSYDWRKATTLTDAQGHRFPGGTGFGVAQGAAAGEYMLFDASGVPTLPNSLRLHLTVPLIAMNVKDHGAANKPATGPCATFLPTDERARTITVHGPFTYNLTVPVAPVHSATIHAVAQAHGVTIQLKRVVITPLVTRVFLQMTGLPSTALNTLTLIGQPAELVVRQAVQPVPETSQATQRNGQIFYHGTPSAIRNRSARDMSFDFALPSSSRYHGPATLIVYTGVVNKPLRARIEETVMVNGHLVTRFVKGGYTPIFTKPIAIHFTMP